MNSKTFFAQSGVRLVCLSTKMPFTQAAKNFRVKLADGKEVVDLAAIFDDEARAEAERRPK
jgi:hypothetical protein